MSVMALRPGRVPEFDSELSRKVESAMHPGSGTAAARSGEIGTIGRTLERFAEAVVTAIEDPHSAADFLAHLDLKLVSRDHDWRKVFEQLQACDLSFDAHKRVLLLRYTQYLSHRLRLLEMVESEVEGLDATSTVSIHRIAQWRGEGIRLHFAESREFHRTMPPVGLTLGERRAELAMLPRPSLSLGERTWALRPGRNLVGRHPECDIIIPGEYREVSRVHLLLDWRSDALSLTNLARQGTGIESESH